MENPLAGKCRIQLKEDGSLPAQMLGYQTLRKGCVFCWPEDPDENDPMLRTETGHLFWSQAHNEWAWSGMVMRSADVVLLEFISEEE